MYIKKETSVLVMINRSLYIYKNKNYMLFRGIKLYIISNFYSPVKKNVKKEIQWITKKYFTLFYYKKHMFLCQVLEKKKAHENIARIVNTNLASSLNTIRLRFGGKPNQTKPKPKPKPNQNQNQNPNGFVLLLL